MNYNNCDIRLNLPAQKLPRKANTKPRKRSNLRRIAVKAAAVVFIITSASAPAQLVLQPNEAQSKDAKVYSFLPSNNFQSNLGVIGSASAPHEFRSLIQFDLSSVPYTAGDITAATLELYAISINTNNGGGPGNVSLRTLTSAWTETGVTWNTFPAFETTPEATVNITTAGQWYSFNVTDVLKEWIDGTTVNHGLGIFMDTPTGDIVLADADGITGSNPDPTKAPRLSITAVPEPGSALLAIIGGIALATRRRRA